MVVRAIPKNKETIELKPGCYNITLQEPYEEEINGEICIRFPFTVAGIVGKIKPFYFYLFMPKDGDNKLKIERFYNKSTAIRECFNSVLPFNELSYKFWKGRKGRVVIGKHRNGKMGVVFFMRNDNINIAREDLSENVHTFKNELL